MTEYYRPIEMRKPRPGARKWALGFFVFTGLVSLGLGIWGMRGSEGKSLFGEVKISYVFDNPSPTVAVTLGGKKVIEQIKARVGQDLGQYAVYVYRLGEKVGYGFGENVKMPIMSIAKIPIMAAVYQQIESGKLSLGASYSVTVADDTDEEASPSATPKTKVVSMTVGQMLTAMGQKSDNAAAGVLIGVAGKTKINQAMTDLGMKDSDFDDNETTARDVAGMWTKLYENKGVISEGHKDKMWTDLQDSIFEDRIAVGIPKGVSLIHKVGTDEKVWIDSGIVGGEKPFVLVILNKEVDLDEAKKTVPEITKMIWEYEKSEQ